MSETMRGAATARGHGPWLVIGTVTAVAVASWGIAPITPADAEAGDLDPTFGDGGIVVTDLPDAPGDFDPHDDAAAVAIQPDGKIVLVGPAMRSDGGGPLVRYQPDGTLDASFGTGGVAPTNYGLGSCALCGDDIALQPDGKILVPGGVMPFPLYWLSGVARLTPDGSLDASFGIGGAASSSTAGIGRAVAVQPDGRILVISTGSTPSGASALTIVRFLADGTVDTSWGIEGAIDVAADETPGGTSPVTAIDVTVQPDGTILAAGSALTDNGTEGLVLVRLHADGSVDTGFGTAGVARVDVLDSPREVVLEPDGTILAGGRSNGQFAIARLHPDGSLDTGFGEDGLATAGQGRATSVAVRPDGGIVAAGDTWQPGGYDIDVVFVVAAFSPAGELDASFGDGGRTTTNHAPDSEMEWANDLALQPDGKVVVVGGAYPAEDMDIVVDRYQGPNTPPFGAMVAGGSCAGDSGATAQLLVLDAETPPGDLTVSAESSNVAVVPDSGLELGGAGSDRTLTVLPAPRTSGEATVTVTVDDGDATATVPVHVVVGSPDSDALSGTVTADVLLGRQGSDTIAAGDGHDLACAGRGDDVLAGDGGDDVLAGDRGDDALTGGPGADRFSGGPGADAATDLDPADGDQEDGTIP